MHAVIYDFLWDVEERASYDPGSLPDPAYGHMREPVLFAANLLRGLNGAVAPASLIGSRITPLGQQLFYPASVFSYFSPFYRTGDGLAAPEFQIYSTQSSANRINLVSSALYAGQLDPGTTFDLSAFVAAASVPANLVAQINTLFFHSSMSTSLETAISQAMNAVTAPSDKARAALYVALTSAEFQIIH